MKMEITTDTIIADVQSWFSRYYPYLKLEFSRPRPGLKALPQILKPASRVLDGILGTAGDLIQVNDNMTVIDLQNLFKDRFGLHVQVWRKSGSAWLETTMTNKWTLKLQNDHGREISTGLPRRYTDPADENHCYT